MVDVVLSLDDDEEVRESDSLVKNGEAMPVVFGVCVLFVS